MLTELIIVLMAGLGAGIVTGLFGGSATLIVVPLMVIFAKYHPYEAIGLALSVDIFSSTAAFSVYNIKKNLTIKPAIPMIASAIIGVVVGSFLSVRIPEHILATLVGIGVLIASTRFCLVCTNLLPRPNYLIKYGKHASYLWGIITGLALGIVGGGGGVVLLMGLTVLMRYPVHKAVGVSVLGMAFIAMVGSVTHYVFMPFPLIAVAVGAVGGISGALISSRMANKLTENRLNLLIGIILGMLGAALLVNAIMMWF